MPNAVETLTVERDALTSARRRAVAEAGTAPIPLPDLSARPAPTRRSIAGRPAGAAAIRRCLELQATILDRSRGPLSRLLGRDPLGPLAREAFSAVQVEASVAQVADRAADWTALHSLPIGADGTDLGHLLVGPAGAVVLVARGSTGGRLHAAGVELTVSGVVDDALRTALTLREDVASRLGVAVGREVPTTAAVVLVGSDPADIERTEVPVLFLDQLERWLAHLPAALEADETGALVDAACRADTWRPRPSTELSDPAELSAFRSLEAEVRSARTRRAAWEVGGLAGAIVLGFGAIAVGLPGSLLHLLGAIVAR